MAHETGIAPTDDLKSKIAESKSTDQLRVLKVIIDNEQLLFSQSVPTSSSFSEDFNKLGEVVEDSTPCYLLIRTDHSNSYGYEWILITYVPVSSKTREKMLYSSTKPALKREFGGNQLKTEYFATEKSDLTHESYSLSQDRSEKPFTEQEIELAKVKEQERQAMRGLGEKVKLSSNISFPPTEAALDVISDFRSGAANFAQFVIDGKNEIIESVVSKSNLSAEDVDSMVPRDRATYNLFRIPVSASDGFIKDQPVIFIHGISNGSGVKEKMLFSSCKSTFMQLLTGEDVGLEIDRKVEVDINDDGVSADFILNEFRVKEKTQKKGFAKPRAPGRQFAAPKV